MVKNKYSHKIKIPFKLPEAEFKAQIWLVPLKIVFNFSRFQVFAGFETRLKFIKFGPSLTIFLKSTS